MILQKIMDGLKRDMRSYVAGLDLRWMRRMRRREYNIGMRCGCGSRLSKENTGRR
jgi:hypothetical protein